MMVMSLWGIKTFLTQNECFLCISELNTYGLSSKIQGEVYKTIGPCSTQVFIVTQTGTASCGLLLIPKAPSSSTAGFKEAPKS